MKTFNFVQYSPLILYNILSVSTFNRDLLCVCFVLHKVCTFTKDCKIHRKSALLRPQYYRAACHFRKPANATVQKLNVYFRSSFHRFLFSFWFLVCLSFHSFVSVFLRHFEVHVVREPVDRPC